MKRLKIISIIISLSFILYIGISWFLLNGRIVYITSYNENTIQESKDAHLFVTDDLEVKTEGDSLVNLKNKIDIWTNKRYKIKYFGILFHWTYTEPEWRYLNIQFKDEMYPQINNWCVKDINEKGYSNLTLIIFYLFQ
jgi:hypothetical protein